MKWIIMLFVTFELKFILWIKDLPKVSYLLRDVHKCVGSWRDSGWVMCLGFIFLASAFGGLELKLEFSNILGNLTNHFQTEKRNETFFTHFSKSIKPLLESWEKIPRSTTRWFIFKLSDIIILVICNRTVSFLDNELHFEL